MQIQPIRSWRTAAYWRYPLCCLPPRCRPLFKKPFTFWLPHLSYVVARDEQIVFRAELVELLGVRPPDLDFALPKDARTLRLELQWPSDELPPPEGRSSLIPEQVIRPWPPDHVMGSVLDLLT